MIVGIPILNLIKSIEKVKAVFHNRFLRFYKFSLKTD